MKWYSAYMDNNTTSPTHQFVLYFSKHDLVDQIGMSLEDVQSDYNLALTYRKDSIKLIGNKPDILKFLNHLNSTTMGMGEDESDWIDLIKPIKK